MRCSSHLNEFQRVRSLTTLPLLGRNHVFTVELKFISFSKTYNTDYNQTSQLGCFFADLRTKTLDYATDHFHLSCNSLSNPLARIWFIFVSGMTLDDCQVRSLPAWDSSRTSSTSILWTTSYKVEWSLNLFCSTYFLDDKALDVNYTGSVPESLGDLKNLDEIYLSENRLHGMQNVSHKSIA